jgi:hypothetical protein
MWARRSGRKAGPPEITAKEKSGMEERRNVKKIKLTRHLIIDGKHAEKGTVVSVPRGKALDIIGSGCAVEHLEPGEAPESAPTTVRVEKPVHADPKPQNADPTTARRKSA